jgi:ABC-2 type transport system ATP-binding protein
MIEVNKLTKTYGDVQAVDGISFKVHAGEILGLLGPNGAGKTSTLECMEGLRKPTSGSLIVAGLDPWRESNKLRKVIGVQLQSAGFPESITPNEAMKIFCAYHNSPPRFDLLDRMGLNEKRNAQFYELSSGQQRRLSLALAVAHHPQILFLDEPTAGLDVITRIELHGLIREMQAINTAIVLATHDMAEAEELSDRVAILLSGRLVAIGTPMEITATSKEMTKISVRTKNASITNLEIPLPAVSRRLSRDGYSIFFSLDIGVTLAIMINYIETHGDTLMDLRVERPSLEDCFLEITRTNSTLTSGVIP